MKNITEHTGTIDTIERMESSRNGNPRYMVTVREDNGGYIQACTTQDSSLGYTIKNYKDGERVRVAIGTHYGKQQIDAIRKA